MTRVKKNDKLRTFLEEENVSADAVIARLVFSELYVAPRNPAIMDSVLNSAEAVNDGQIFRRQLLAQSVEESVERPEHMGFGKVNKIYRTEMHAPVSPSFCPFCRFFRNRNRIFSKNLLDPESPSAAQPQRSEITGTTPFLPRQTKFGLLLEMCWLIFAIDRNVKSSRFPRILRL